MREILFRGKRCDNEKWVEGYLMDENYINVPFNDDEACGRFDDPVEIDPSTVCQYTGLTDKNGRKIFEGDIVKDIFNASVVGIVRYGEYRNTFNDDEYGGHAGFYIKWKEKECHLRKDLVYWVKNSEFIGSIFDNPELMEGEQ